MKKQSTYSLSWRTLLKPLEKTLSSVTLVMLGVSMSGFPVLLSSASEVTAKQAQPSEKPSNSSGNVLANGVYLYGQSPKPDQLGQAYIVFEVRDSKVMGAFYMPRSSFDCVHGSFQTDQLALTVVDSYDHTTHPYAIALQKQYAVASNGNPVLEKLGLEGLHRINSVSENDQRILATCKADGQNQI